MRMSREKGEELLQKLNRRMEEDAEVLEAWYPNLKQTSLRWQWEVDEEDGAMEWLTGTDGADEKASSPRPKTIYDLLGSWRARECYPKEFVIALLTGELP
jgi:hypothetical protein